MAASQLSSASKRYKTVSGFADYPATGIHLPLWPELGKKWPNLVLLPIILCMPDIGETPLITRKER
jgi:hypothetical protein